MTLGDKPNLNLRKTHVLSRNEVGHLIADRMNKFISRYNDESHVYSDEKYYDTLYKYEDLLIKKYPNSKKVIKSVVRDIEDGTILLL